MNHGITAVLITLILVTMYAAKGNFRAVEEYKSPRVLTGTFHELTKSNLGRSRPYFVKLKEYKAKFIVDRITKPAFDVEKFINVVEPGDRIEVHISKRVNINEYNASVSQIKHNGIIFVDPEKRNSRRRINAYGAVFCVILFTGGLLHHMIKPWAG